MLISFHLGFTLFIKRNYHHDEMGKNEPYLDNRASKTFKKFSKQSRG